METQTAPRWYNSISDIKQANKELGHSFFSPDAMEFFGSKVLPTVYDGRFFITSEQDNFSNGARKYTVREAKSDGSIDTIGNFQQFATAKQAQKALRYYMVHMDFPRD